MARDGSCDSVRLQDLEGAGEGDPRVRTVDFWRTEYVSKKCCADSPASSQKRGSCCGDLPYFKENSPKSSGINILYVQKEQEIHQGCLANQGIS